MMKQELQNIERELKNYIRRYNKMKFDLELCYDYKDKMITKKELGKYMNKYEVEEVTKYTKERILKIDIEQYNLIKEISDNLPELYKELDKDKYELYSKTFDMIMKDYSNKIIK